jgi:hypothetical protein
MGKTSRISAAGKCHVIKKKHSFLQSHMYNINNSQYTYVGQNIGMFCTLYSLWLLPKCFGHLSSIGQGHNLVCKESSDLTVLFCKFKTCMYQGL